MSMLQWFELGRPLRGAPGVRTLTVAHEAWLHAAGDFAAANGRLLALWADAERDGVTCVRAALAGTPGVLVIDLPVASADGFYPGLEDLYPAASRMQRAAADLFGVHSTNGDRRPWLLHGTDANDYAFVSVDGAGVHEIPVGPVHAGIIEPGHFRFSVVGEKVLRLEQRLGYTHKGIERRFREFAALDGHRLAARVSGDSAVAFSWAYCEALEGLAQIEIPVRAAWLRALCLELERVANHLGDLGALGNDAGFAFGLTQFSRLKEMLLRATQQVLGQRYLLDAIVPGGMRPDLDPAGAAVLKECAASTAAQAAILRDIYDEHSGLRGRFGGAGVVTPQLAARLGLTGLAGRASGQAFDLRVDLPAVPYADLDIRKCGHDAGDVAARVAVRFDELFESCRLVRQIIERLPAGAHWTPVPAPPAGELGLGLIEGWRGPVLLALIADSDGRVWRCHPHDPSWQNWPVLEHAIIDNIVPDFPLINKSFNLSYSGHDL
jgi:Ni,Fe-hydrogenase III large subunit